MVLGSANYSLGPAFQLRYRQGKLLLTGSAKPSCSWLFSCHCDCNLRQNTILHFLKPRRKDVKVGEKRQTYFGSKATKEIWGVLPIQHLLLMLLFPRFLRLYIYISRLQAPTVFHLPDALWVSLDSMMNCNVQILKLPENWAGSCTTPNEVCPVYPWVPAAHLLKAVQDLMYRNWLFSWKLVNHTQSI